MRGVSSINTDNIGDAGYCSAGDATIDTSASATDSANGSRTNASSENSESSSDSNSHDNSSNNNEATKAQSAKESSSRILDKWKEFLESSPYHYKKSTHLRYNDGIPSWEKQLQQWSQDVAAYITKSTARLGDSILRNRNRNTYVIGCAMRRI